MRSHGRLHRIVDKLREINQPMDYNMFSQSVESIKQGAENLSGSSDNLLREKYLNIRSAMQSCGESENMLLDVFSLVTEAVRRTMGMKLFNGQIAAGIALQHGHMVQMNTGEGKTLSAVLPACYAALRGGGCHVLTFNDYLAGRDAEWMSPVYNLLGITVGVIQKQMPPEEKRKSYSADITYATATEAGFDFLRDNLVFDSEDLVQRPFASAIVDEADSILIDGARIPLVIAGELRPPQMDPYRTAAMVKGLVEGLHWEKDEGCRNAYFTSSGFSFLEKSLGCGNLHKNKNRCLLEELNNSLHAMALLKANVDYIVREQRIEIIDQFTGRVAPDRRWPDGLQGALEAREGVPIQPGGRILGSIPLQYFFLLYPKLSGLTATAEPAHQEFLSFYNLDLVCIPPEKECRRIDHEDVVFTHIHAKRRAIVREIHREHCTGRPVLVGTGTVEESEQLAAQLSEKGMKCSVLNARNDLLEASIIADAGSPEAITISTNMAGRGTDIRLGGSDQAGRDRVVSLGGLHVIGTNRHESKRIDDQLRGRSGRQGDPGSSRFFVSMEDDLMTRFGIEHLIPRKSWPEDSDEPVKDTFVQKEMIRLQTIVEEQNFEIRKTLRDYSLIVELQRRRLHEIRRNILLEACDYKEFLDKTDEHRLLLQKVFTMSFLRNLEKRLLLFNLDQCWADHLAEAAHLQDGIHLVAIGGLSPLQEFQHGVCIAFEKCLQEISERSVSMYNSIHTEEDARNLMRGALKCPSSTWTYLVNDRTLGNLDQIFLAGSNSPFTAAAVMTTWPLLLAAAVRRRFRKKTDGA